LVTFYLLIYVRRVWRYQRGNQNPYIEEEQTNQWPKEKVPKDKQRSTKNIHKTKVRVTRTALKAVGELMSVRSQSLYSPHHILWSAKCKWWKSLTLNTWLALDAIAFNSVILVSDLMPTANISMFELWRSIDSVVTLYTPFERPSVITTRKLGILPLSPLLALKLFNCTYCKALPVWVDVIIGVILLIACYMSLIFVNEFM
jgi:hypothetical protein